MEVKLLDKDEGVHGIADALLIEDGSAVLVELKASHKVTLGHKLQAMLYEKLVKRLYGVGRVGAFVVYRYGVEEVRCDERMPTRYMRRVRAVLDLDAPPPALPRELNSRCENCPYRFVCARYQHGSWDDWLVRIGDYPVSEERCGDCPHLKFCRAFKAKTGEYPCTSKQTLLV